jgi:D-3-phosphoglycerate dehydrogenase
MKHKVLIIQMIHQAGIDLLAKEAEVFVASSTNPEQVKLELADCDGCIVRVSPLTADVINAAPKLKVIGRHGVGYDNIDIVAAAKRGIPVVYAPGSNDISVAEHAVSLMAGLSKALTQADKALKERGDYQFRMAVKTTEMFGKTVGVIGLGSIGRKVAAICKNGFNMNVIAYDKFVQSSVAEQMGIKMVDDILSLMAAADFVTVHVPYNTETFHLIGEKEFVVMKKTAFFINTSRGPVVDEAALINALQENRFRGAGLDVFEVEPTLPDNPLFSMDNVIVTPHMAAHTEEGLIRMATVAAQGVLDVLNGRTPQFVANKSLL